MQSPRQILGRHLQPGLHIEMLCALQQGRAWHLFANINGSTNALLGGQGLGGISLHRRAASCHVEL